MVELLEVVDRLALDATRNGLGLESAHSALYRLNTSELSDEEHLGWTRRALVFCVAQSFLCEAKRHAHNLVSKWPAYCTQNQTELAHLLRAAGIDDPKISTNESLHGIKNYVDVWEAIDAFVYINLAHRTDRKNELIAELGRCGVPMSKVHRFNAIVDDPPCLGTTKSHVCVLQMAVLKGWRNVCVLEDDFNFVSDSKTVSNNIAKFFASHLEQNFDVLMLTGNVQRSIPCDNFDFDFVEKVRESQVMAAYIVHASFYAKLLARLRYGADRLKETGQHWNYTCDQSWKSLQTGNWFIFKPQLGYQRPSFSDLAGRFVDYNNKIPTTDNNNPTENPISGSYSNSVSERDSAYIEASTAALTTESAFNVFRQDWRYSGIHENVTADQGMQYHNETHDEAKQALHKISERDNVGSPITMEVANVRVSPTTLRHLKVASDLHHLFGSKFLAQATIVQIGVGYGGLCKVLSEFIHLRAGETFLVDLPLTCSLAEKFISKTVQSDKHTKKSGIYFVTSKMLEQESQTDLDIALQHTEVSLVISNYAFSEFDASVRQQYLKRILNRCTHGYLTINTLTDSDSQELRAMLHDVDNRIVSVLPETPNTSPENHVITWHPKFKTESNATSQNCFGTNTDGTHDQIVIDVDAKKTASVLCPQIQQWIENGGSAILVRSTPSNAQHVTQFHQNKNVRVIENLPQDPKLIIEFIQDLLRRCKSEIKLLRLSMNGMEHKFLEALHTEFIKDSNDTKPGQNPQTVIVDSGFLWHPMLSAKTPEDCGLAQPIRVLDKAMTSKGYKLVDFVRGELIFELTKTTDAALVACNQKVMSLWSKEWQVLPPATRQQILHKRMSNKTIQETEQCWLSLDPKVFQM